MELYKVSKSGTAGAYSELLRTPDISAGVYRLAVGSEDRQTPHGEDEVYFVVSGHGRFGAGGRDAEVSAGDLLFVPAEEQHYFHDIDQELVLLVVFGPAEGARNLMGN